MKTYLFILVVFVSALACKSKKEAQATTTTNKTEEAATAAEPKSSGIVTNQYKGFGCTAVVIIRADDGDITLIPMDNSLFKEFDVDGTEITFNYITLRMPQPEGCTVGIPAKLSNITKKK